MSKIGYCKKVVVSILRHFNQCIFTEFNENNNEEERSGGTTGTSISQKDLQIEKTVLRISKKGEKNSRFVRSILAIFHERESKEDLFIDGRDRGENGRIMFMSDSTLSIRTCLVRIIISCIELTVSFFGFYTDWVTVLFFKILC